MSWHDGADFASAAHAYNFSVGKFAALGQVTTQRLRIHVVSLFVDIDELRQSPGLRDGLRSRDERVRHCHYNIAVLYAGCDQRKPQGISPVGSANAVFSFAKLCKSLFKLLHERTANETSGAQNTLKDFR